MEEAPEARESTLRVDGGPHRMEEPQAGPTPRLGCLESAMLQAAITGPR